LGEPSIYWKEQRQKGSGLGEKETGLWGETVEERELWQKKEVTNSATLGRLARTRKTTFFKRRSRRQER